MNDSESKFFDIDDALCFALYKAHRRMNNSYRPFLEELNLTYPQFLLMLCLWNKNEQSQKEICKLLDLDSGTLTPMIKRLIGLNLITKHRCHRDERTVVLKLTPFGAQLQEKAKSIPERMFCQLKLGVQDFVQIREGVKVLIKNLEKDTLP